MNRLLFVLALLCVPMFAQERDAPDITLDFSLSPGPWALCQVYPQYCLSPEQQSSAQSVFTVRTSAGPEITGYHIVLTHADGSTQIFEIPRNDQPLGLNADGTRFMETAVFLVTGTVASKSIEVGATRAVVTRKQVF